ncbi:MAG TPA: sulfite oxidase [Gemmatimonadaceae bacterium]|nr:sulfite oxidase [Gemmatimonadaceae bacterium]
MRDTEQISRVGLTIRQKEPVNLETPLDRVDSYLTPAELFYIRDHFKAPAIDVASYRLRVDGAVAKPLSLTYGELRELPAETRIAVMECAGNGRVFLVPPVPGTQWELGAVGNAEWTGVPLAALLERVGLHPDACEIVLEGADRGTPNERPLPPEPISYARSLAKDKAVNGDVLIAYSMNGRDLPLHHGYPVRAVVPGHYGMASVKWLTRIEAVREPFRGYWQTTDYGYWARVDGKPVRQPLGEVRLKSEIVRPRIFETVAPNEIYTITGIAWAGETDVTGVDVTTNGGQTWSEATFLDPIRRYAWRRWTFDWLTPGAPGRYVLRSRATSADGSAQPREHDPNYGNYVIDHTLPIEVFVEAADASR